MQFATTQTTSIPDHPTYFNSYPAYKYIVQS